MTEVMDQSSEIPVSSLLSRTSYVQERHGELSELISTLPIVSCEELSRVSSRAIGEYFKQNQTPATVRQQVRKVAKGLSEATSATLRYIQDESLPDVNVDDYFEGLELQLCNKEGKLIDQTIRGVLGSISIGSYFDHGEDNRTYLFRVETGNPELNMITELHRWKIPDLHPIAAPKHVDIKYMMSVAGYDAIE